jgi:WD40 repeat protein
MDAIEPEEDPATGSKNYFSTSFGTPQCEQAAEKLYESLELIEQKIPTYRIDRAGSKRALGKCTSWLDDSDEEFKLEDYGLGGIHENFWLENEDKISSISFTQSILQPIKASSRLKEPGTAGVHALSFEYLVELEKNPWRFNNMLALPVCVGDEAEEESKDELVLQHIKVLPRVKLRDAIGDKRYRAWKIANDHKDEEDMLLGTPLIEKADIEDAFDLSSILLGAPELPLEGSSQPRDDRNKVRQCLELAFGSGDTNFKENGRDLIVEAELALRNPSAQRFLFSVLSQRAKIENQRRKRTQEELKRPSTQQSVLRLEPNAFDSICRLCYAMLEACKEEQNYESAYKLLTYTGGFCTTSTANAAQSAYMTERITLHPIFADLRLWERVLLLHQQDQQNDRKDEDDESSHSGSAEDSPDAEAYEAAVSTLYEMLGYGVPAEELARFATRVSEEKGWFATEKGQALLVLARRLTAKRDEGGEGDITDDVRGSDFSFTRKDSSLAAKDVGGGALETYSTLESEEIAWFHPSICPRNFGARAFAISSNSSHGYGSQRSCGSIPVFDAPGHAGRVAITAMATFGNTAVVTGAVDGSVFLAHTIHFGDEKNEYESGCSMPRCSSPLHSKANFVNGLQLQWGAKGDGEDTAGSGSVRCLVAAKGSGYRFGGPDIPAKKPGSCPDEEEIVAELEGCRVIAGMTSGGLRVWSLKDIYQAGCLLRRDGTDPSHSSGANDFGMKEAIAGVAIGGHRGGVTCIDVPPSMYRPDSLLSGGEDGLIKLWTLKSLSPSDQSGVQSPQRQPRFFNSRQILPVAPIDFDASDAQVLTGHQGRIICIKTAWHGDKLLSGGADKTIRLWDLSGSTGKPLSTLRGHQGIITQTHFWGPNTIVSASTDRSIALWDTRAGSSPIFALRHHLAPVSDLILGNRSEPLMISAGADGAIATWDFRVLSGTVENAEVERPRSSRTVRTPIRRMNHIEQSSRLNNCGSVKLSRALGRDDFSFLSVSDDGIINEWDALSGSKLSSYNTGHKDAISGFQVYSSKDGMRQNRKCGVNSSVGGVVSCSWDGTVRLRRLSRKPAR